VLLEVPSNHRTKSASRHLGKFEVQSSEAIHVARGVVAHTMILLDKSDGD
jgi:hypothetical protein